MLGGGKMKAIYDLRAEGVGIREIARRLDLTRVTVRKYLRSETIPVAKPRPLRVSKLAPWAEYIVRRVRVDGVDNCSVLLDELRERGYDGGRTILKEFVQPLRLPKAPIATVRFETQPGEQAQVDFGTFRYRGAEGKIRRVYAFVMVLSWSRSLYVEFVERQDWVTFVRCHLHAFEAFGGVPTKCLYDNTKVVVLDRDEAGQPIWNVRFLDFARRAGFTVRLCRPYRAQTKGRVESGVKYVRRNFWVRRPAFTDLADLNRQARTWRERTAEQRIHGTTFEQPAMLLREERGHLQPLGPIERFLVFLREERQVGRDGFVAWGANWYGVNWRWARQAVQVAATEDMIEIWAGEQRLAVHARSWLRGKRFPVPGQWDGLPLDNAPRVREVLATQVPVPEVEERPLSAYEAAAR